MRQQHPDNEKVFPETRGHGYPSQQLPEGLIEVDDPTGGMVTSVPHDKVSPGSWLKLRNARTRQEWVGRRPGTGEVGGKPNDNPILNLVTFINEAGNIAVIRLTEESAHFSWGAGQWHPLEHDIGGSPERFNVARMFDWLFFANGQDKIRHLDLGSEKLLQIEDAPQALTVVNFADRIIAANLRLSVGGVRPSAIAWSANSDPFDWTSESSGSEDLVQGQGGLGDPIVRLFSVGGELIILRKRSIWHGTRQPFAIAPLSFREVISGIGCDLPHTAVEVEGGILFADQRTKSVYFYRPGARPERISQINDRELFKDLRNLTWAQGVFDPFEKEYHLGLSTTSLFQWITKVWVFSMVNGSWSYDDGPVISAMSITSAPADITTIDDLIGTIDSLEGTIDELNSGGPLRPQLYKGTATGEFIEQSYDHDTDWDGGEVEFEAVSQNIGGTSKRRTIKDLLVKIHVDGLSTVILEHSIDAIGWRNSKSMNFLADERVQHARLPKKLTTAPRLYWRLRTTGPVRIIGHWVRMLEKGLQR